MEDLAAEVVVDLAAGVGEAEEDLVVEAVVVGEVADLVVEAVEVDLAAEEDLEDVVVVKDLGVGAAVVGMEAVVAEDTITGTVVEVEDSITETAEVLRRALRAVTGRISDRSLNDLIVVAIRFSNCIYH